MFVFFLFFFSSRRRHTRCGREWSSDVCSSDLIKSEGDFEAARKLVEKYAVKIDPVLHAEILARYEKLHLAPYKGFVNPVYEAVTDKDGNIIDVKVSYNEGYAEQMLRYSKEFANLPYRNE